MAAENGHQDNQDSLPLRNIPTQALVVGTRGAPFKLTQIILDEVRDNEVLVEVMYSGVCHTHGVMPGATYPIILGHEGCGIVRRVGCSVLNPRLRIGRPVFLSFNTCRHCRFCHEGQLGSCPEMTPVNFTGGRLLGDGSSPARLAATGESVRAQFFGQSSFSRLSIVREQSVIAHDGDLEPNTMAALAPLGCGYNTGASTVLDVLQPREGTSLAVAGAGAVGLAAIMAARALGVRRIIAIDVVTAKLELAKEVGATHTIDSSSSSISDIATAIRDILPEGVDQILETTGVTTVIERGVAALSHGGTMALVGVPRPEHHLSLDPLDLLLSCKKIVGVIAGYSNPQESLPRLIQLHQQGQLPVEKLMKIYPATQLDQAITDLKAGRVVKPVLSWNDL
ncbi:hypothetical protein LTS17_001433 [Exophiala oligosperma]